MMRVLSLLLLLLAACAQQPPPPAEVPSYMPAYCTTTTRLPRPPKADDRSIPQLVTWARTAASVANSAIAERDACALDYARLHALCATAAGCIIPATAAPVAPRTTSVAPQRSLQTVPDQLYCAIAKGATTITAPIFAATPSAPGGAVPVLAVGATAADVQRQCRAAAKAVGGEVAIPVGLPTNAAQLAPVVIPQ